MSQTVNTFIGSYVKAVKQNNAAVFAGAGLSKPAGFVNWKELLQGIAGELKLDINLEHDLVAIAQYHYNEKGGNRNTLNQLMIDEFTKETSITDNHKILSSLPISSYWTTNYDTLIETALGDAGKTPDVKITQENLSTNRAQRDAIVYKMHGDVSLAHDVVITKDDYEGYNEKRPLFTTALQGDLVSKTFLFIGFSFDDPNLEQILGRIRILLGQNKRDHYCFLKKVERKEYKSDAEFLYAEIKQDLKIKDLKRYSINAVLLDSYPQVTSILESIRKKIIRSNIFVSGAAVDFSPKKEQEGLDFIHRLSYELASKKYKIVSGFGTGVGSAVVNGVLQYQFSTKYRRLDDALLMRPFPQIVSDGQDRKILYTQYRKEMISNSGIVIFLYGNKDSNGSIEMSDGMLEEFDIALQCGTLPLPIGATGYIAEQLWEKVTESLKDYYPDNAELLDAVVQLGNKSLNDEELINQIVKAVGILQTQE